MAKFKFNKPYQDHELKREVKAGEKVEMTIKRADELVNEIRKQAQKFPRFQDYRDFDYERVDVQDEKEKEPATEVDKDNKEPNANPAKETKAKKAKDKE